MEDNRTIWLEASSKKRVVLVPYFHTHEQPTDQPIQSPSWRPILINATPVVAMAVVETVVAAVVESTPVRIVATVVVAAARIAAPMVDATMVVAVVGRGRGVAGTEPLPYSTTTSRYESLAAVVAQVAVSSNPSTNAVQRSIVHTTTATE